MSDTPKNPLIEQSWTESLRPQDMTLKPELALEVARSIEERAFVLMGKSHGDKDAIEPGKAHPINRVVADGLISAALEIRIAVADKKEVRLGDILDKKTSADIRTKNGAVYEQYLENKGSDAAKTHRGVAPSDMVLARVKTEVTNAAGKVLGFEQVKLAVPSASPAL